MALYLGPFLGIISVHCLAIARATGPVKEISKTQQKPVAGLICRGKKKKEIKKVCVPLGESAGAIEIHIKTSSEFNQGMIRPHA